MNDRDPNRLADQLEREAQELQRRSGELQDHVKEMQEDWQRKRADQSIPGAQRYAWFGYEVSMEHDRGRSAVRATATAENDS